MKLLWLGLSIVLASAAQPTAVVGRHAVLIANFGYTKLPVRTSPQVNVDAIASSLGKARFQPEIAMAASKTGLAAISVNLDDGSAYAARGESHLDLSLDRVVRGGSWNDPKGYLRDSARDHKPPNKQENTVGFRCIAEVE